MSKVIDQLQDWKKSDIPCNMCGNMLYIKETYGSCTSYECRTPMCGMNIEGFLNSEALKTVGWIYEDN